MASKTKTGALLAETFAVIKTGGKQYIVAEGDILTIEKLPQTTGDKVIFEEVLLVGGGDTLAIGNPFLSGKTVSGEIIEEGKAKKVTVIKYKAKSRYFKKRGHRQPFLKVKIGKIGK